MVIPVEPLQVSSLKQACIERLEGMILSGGLKPGEKLRIKQALARKRLRKKMRNIQRRLD